MHNKNNIHTLHTLSVIGVGSRPGCMSQAPCSVISFIPTVLKSNVLATESSFSMNDSSSSSQRHVLIDLRCSVLLLLLQKVPNRKWFTLV